MPLASRRPPRKPNFLHSNVLLDHYHIARGEEGTQLIKEENKVRGKRMFPSPLAATEIAQCFRSPPDVPSPSASTRGGAVGTLPPIPTGNSNNNNPPPAEPQP